MAEGNNREQYEWAPGYRLTNDPVFWGIVYAVILIIAAFL
jgi:hypothetical protein